MGALGVLAQLWCSHCPATAGATGAAGLVMSHIASEKVKMAIERVTFPIEHGDSP